MTTTPLTETELTDALAALPGWALAAAGGTGQAITRTYAMPTYMAGLAFAAAVGTLAEGRDHHPEIVIGWKRVTVTFSTHDAGNAISAKDIDAAQAVDALGYPRA